MANLCIKLSFLSFLYRVRRDLNLNFKTSGLYFDLSSNDETMKRITMLPEKMPDEVKNMLTQFYGDVISELDNKSANEMLVSTFLMCLISLFTVQ